VHKVTLLILHMECGGAESKTRISYLIAHLSFEVSTCEMSCGLVKSLVIINVTFTSVEYNCPVVSAQWMLVRVCVYSILTSKEDICFINWEIGVIKFRMFTYFVTFQCWAVSGPIYRKEFFFWFIRRGEWNNRNWKNGQVCQKWNTANLYVIFICTMLTKYFIQELHVTCCVTTWKPLM
jgi:hypothetical protein